MDELEKLVMEMVNSAPVPPEGVVLKMSASNGHVRCVAKKYSNNTYTLNWVDVEYDPNGGYQGVHAPGSSPSW